MVSVLLFVSACEEISGTSGKAVTKSPSVPTTEVSVGPAASVPSSSGGGSSRDSNQTINGNCTDSDGGRIYDVYGYTSFIDENGELNLTYDQCLGSNGILETYCITEDISYSEYKNCLSLGYDSCVNGACYYEQINQTTNETCFDSDGGQNYYVKGTVISHSGTYTDLCWGDSGEMTEYTCQNNEVFATPFQCSSLCEDGACVGTPTNGTHMDCSNIGYMCIEVAGSGPDGCEIDTDCAPYINCTDTDGGLNYYVYGTATSIWGTVLHDSCHLDTNNSIEYVAEAYCLPDGDLNNVLFVCPDVCLNGACVNQGNVTCGELGGKTCGIYGTCYGEEVNSADSNECCLGTCRKTFIRQIMEFFRPQQN